MFVTKMVSFLTMCRPALLSRGRVGHSHVVSSEKVSSRSCPRCPFPLPLSELPQHTLPACSHLFRAWSQGVGTQTAGTLLTHFLRRGISHGDDCHTGQLATVEPSEHTCFCGTPLPTRRGMVHRGDLLTCPQGHLHMGQAPGVGAAVLSSRPC